MFTWKNFIKVPTRATSDRSNLPASTEFVHNVVDAGGGSGGACPVSFSVAQTAHGLTTLTPVYFNTTTNLWTKARADTRDTLATHTVIAVPDADTLTLGQVGKYTITNHGLVEGYWYTSSGTAGTLCQVTGAYSNPMLFVVDANTVICLGYRPSATGGYTGEGESLSFAVTQASHGFSLLTPVYFDGSTGLWTKAIATAASTLATHIVIGVTDTNNVVLGQVGKFTITGHGYATGYWYTSDTVAGETSQTPGAYANLVFSVLDANTIICLGHLPSLGGGGGSLPSRGIVSCVSNTMAFGSTWVGSVQFPSDSADILRITTDYPAWVRLYNTVAARDRDVNRPKYQRPSAGCDIIADNITTSDKLSISQSPTHVFHNEDDPRLPMCYVAITNLDATSRMITLTLQYLQREA